MSPIFDFRDFVDKLVKDDSNFVTLSEILLQFVLSFFLT